MKTLKAIWFYLWHAEHDRAGLAIIREHGQMTDVNWDEARAFAEALDGSPEIVRQAFDNRIHEWNQLIWALSKLAKDGAPYEGETSEELLALLKTRLEKT